MLAIIGSGRTNSAGVHAIQLKVKGADSDVVIKDFAKPEDVDYVLSLPAAQLFGRTLVIQHAHIALSPAQDKRVVSLIYRLCNFKHFGFSDVILLTQEVVMIPKVVRDMADVAFDLS